MGICVPGTSDAWDCAPALRTAVNILCVSAQLQDLPRAERTFTSDKMLVAGAVDPLGLEKLDWELGTTICRVSNR